MSGARDSEGEVLVRLEGVSKRYETGSIVTEVLTDVDLTIRKLSFTVVFGVSGCGKTTLLNLIAALDKPSSGSVVVDGVTLSSLDEPGRTEFRRTKLGIVFQYYNLLPTLTALENVEAALEIAGTPGRQTRARAGNCLEMVGLSHCGAKFPSELSGGEQQRVAIARALAKKPLLIVADEPTGNLDEETGLDVMTLMSELRHRKETTLVVATHNTRLAALADCVVRIEQGRVHLAHGAHGAPAVTELSR